MEERFKKELNSWKKIDFLNLGNLTTDEINKLPLMYGTRTVVLTSDNEVVLIKIKTGNFHTLVGGNIEDTENIEQGTIRECKEESGYNISIIDNLGYIVLCKKKYKKYIFGNLVKTIGEPIPLKLTQEEIELGHEILKYPIDEALDILETDYSNTGILAAHRSYIFLKEAQKYLKNMVK